MRIVDCYKPRRAVRMKAAKDILCSKLDKEYT